MAGGFKNFNSVLLDLFFSGQLKTVIVILLAYFKNYLQHLNLKKFEHFYLILENLTFTVFLFCLDLRYWKTNLFVLLV